jgi:hypothetical protein
MLRFLRKTSNFPMIAASVPTRYRGPESHSAGPKGHPRLIGTRFGVPLAGLQVPISDGEQVGDFLPARLVLLEPSEFEPVL